MNKIIIISISLLLLTSCFKNSDIETKINESTAVGEKITVELGGVASGSGEKTVSNTGPSSLDFKN